MARLLLFSTEDYASGVSLYWWYDGSRPSWIWSDAVTLRLWVLILPTLVAFWCFYLFQTRANQPSQTPQVFLVVPLPSLRNEPTAAGEGPMAPVASAERMTPEDGRRVIV